MRCNILRFSSVFTSFKVIFTPLGPGVMEINPENQHRNEL